MHVQRIALRCRVDGGIFAGGSEGADGLTWRDGTADSSGSEAGRDESLDTFPQEPSTPSSVVFTLGGDM